MATNFFKVKKGQNLEPQAGSVVTTKGDIAYNSATDKVELHNGAVDSVVTEADTATLTNKTIDTATNEIQGTADKAAQFNTSTGDLEASTVSNTELGYVSGVTSPIQTQLDALSGAAIDSLTGDVTATGPGAAAATVVSVGGSSAANIHSAELAANAATPTNTPNTIVDRDGSGNFAAGVITADLNGNAATATTVTTNANLTGDVTSVGNATTYAGTVPINKGGTGQTTKTPAFDALQPMTALGDIIVGSTAGSAIRKAVGTENQVLSVIGGIPTWAPAASGGVNYISGNPGAEVNTAGWLGYSNTASNVPTTGTGGSFGGTFARTATGVLRGTASFLMAQPNSTSLQGNGVSYDFSIDNADKASVLGIQFDYNASSTFLASDGRTSPLNDGTTSTNAGNSDIEVFMYDVTNSKLCPVSPSVITSNGSNNFKFNGSFQTSDTGINYRLILHVATASANATGYQFRFDDVAVGPGFGTASATSSGTARPTVQKFLSGSGTYNLPSPAPLYLRVRMVGGGGAGSGQGNSGHGGPGIDTTFGADLVAGGGAGGGDLGGSPAIGGTASLGSITTGIALHGASGNSGPNNSTGVTAGWAGGAGGSSAFGGAGAGGEINAVNGYPGEANTGGGGGGGASNYGVTTWAGSGGGAGGYVEALLTGPTLSYAYSVGTGGTGGGSGGAGGNGGSGVIIVEEFYSTSTGGGGSNSGPIIASVTGAPPSAAAGSPLIWPTINFDTNGAYNNSTGEFSAPISGYYRLSAFIFATNDSIIYYAYNNGVQGVALGSVFTGQATSRGNVSVVIKANAGDLLTIRPNSTTGAFNGSSSAGFEFISGSTSNGSSATKSSVRLSSPSGTGSTETGVRIFTVAANSGSAFTIANITGGSASGTSITINESGVYCFAVNGDFDTSGNGTSISVNSTTLTTSRPAESELIALDQLVALTRGSVTSGCVPLKAGDVVRYQVEGTMSATSYCWMTATKVG